MSGGIVRHSGMFVPTRNSSVSSPLEEPVSADPDPWDPEVIAEDRGCYVVYPAFNQVQLDIDTDEQYQLYLRRKQDWTNLEKHYDVPKWINAKETISQNGNRHITIDFDTDLDDRERVLMQMAFGSDPI